MHSPIRLTANIATVRAMITRGRNKEEEEVVESAVKNDDNSIFYFLNEDLINQIASPSCSSNIN